MPSKSTMNSADMIQFFLGSVSHSFYLCRHHFAFARLRRVLRAHRCAYISYGISWNCDCKIGGQKTEIRLNQGVFLIKCPLKSPFSLNECGALTNAPPTFLHPKKNIKHEKTMRLFRICPNRCVVRKFLNAYKKCRAKYFW